MCVLCARSAILTRHARWHCRPYAQGSGMPLMHLRRRQAEGGLLDAGFVLDSRHTEAADFALFGRPKHAGGAWDGRGDMHTEAVLLCLVSCAPVSTAAALVCVRAEPAQGDFEAGAMRPAPHQGRGGCPCRKSVRDVCCVPFQGPYIRTWIRQCSCHTQTGNWRDLLYLICSHVQA